MDVSCQEKVRESPFLTVFCCMNAIAVMTMLPVSIGGLGVRESALVTFFVPMGLTPEQSVTLGLL